MNKFIFTFLVFYSLNVGFCLAEDQPSNSNPMHMGNGDQRMGGRPGAGPMHPMGSGRDEVMGHIMRLNRMVADKEAKMTVEKTADGVQVKWTSDNKENAETIQKIGEIMRLSYELNETELKKKKAEK